MIMDELALDGYQAIAVGHQVDSCWDFIALLPYTDDLRSDSADVVDSLIDLGLDIRVLTGHSVVHIAISCCRDFCYCHFL